MRLTLHPAWRRRVSVEFWRYFPRRAVPWSSAASIAAGLGATKKSGLPHRLSVYSGPIGRMEILGSTCTVSPGPGGMVAVIR